MLSEPGGPFIHVDRIDLRNYVSRPNLARVLCDYMVYVEHNMKRALELCALATVEAGYRDWWWKARLGKCYYQLGLLRDAEKQFESALKIQDMILTLHELNKVYLRLDQPGTALQQYQAAAKRHPKDSSLVLGVARVQEALGSEEAAVETYKDVLALDSSNVESIACLAAYNFYQEKPEVALRYYRRLLQMGVVNAEVWNNLGLCCFYSSQYDMALGCFERALVMAEEDCLPEVWYNIGQVAVGIGDLGLAHQCFKITVTLNPDHIEAHNNLGVLEARKGNDDQARAYFRTGHKISPHVYEPFYNGALLAQKQGNLQESYVLVTKALEAYPEHTESRELLRQLRQQLILL